MGSVVGVPNPRTDWNQIEPTKADFLKNKPDFYAAIKGKAIDDHYTYIMYVDEWQERNVPRFVITMYYEPDGYNKAPFDSPCMVINSLWGFDLQQTAISLEGEGIKTRNAYVGGNIEEVWSNNIIPTKISQLEREHAEHIWGDQIDTKYKVGEYIPSILIYESSDGYENAPFESDGIIITHSCEYIDNDGIKSRLAYQFAMSYDGILKHRCALDEEFADVAWLDNLIPTKLSELKDDIGFADVKSTHDTLMDGGWDTDTIISAFECAFEACQIANENVGRIKSVETGLNANALKGSVSDTFVSLTDVSPVKHKVKTNIYSKNLVDLSNVYKTTYTDYRVEDNKLIIKKTNPNTNSYSNIFFTIGKCKDFSNKTLTVSITNESSNIFSTHFVHAKDGTVYTNEPICRLGNVGANKTTVITGTIPDNDMDAILCLRIVSQSTTVTDEEYTLSNIQVEYGTQATDYTPYADISNATVKVCGRNLFDYKTTNYVSSKADADVEGDILKVSSSINGTYQHLYYKVIKPQKFGYVYYSFKAKSGNEKTIPLIRVRIRDKDGTLTTIMNFTPTVDEWGSYSGKHQITLNTLEKEAVYEFVIYVNQSTTAVKEGEAFVELKDIMFSFEDIPYEPYQGGATYTPDADGNIEIDSMSPAMSIGTDTAGAMITVEYNKDINKVIEQLQNAIISLGGNV